MLDDPDDTVLGPLAGLVLDVVSSQEDSQRFHVTGTQPIAVADDYYGLLG